MDYILYEQEDGSRSFVETVGVLVIQCREETHIFQPGDTSPIKCNSVLATDDLTVALNWLRSATNDS